MIRPAASVVVLRHGGGAGLQVLMGRRGDGAAFMPAKHVFPGGGVDAADHGPGADVVLKPRCHGRLVQDCAPDAPAPAALARAALRELTEETGLCLRPDPTPLQFLARAITPPGRSRRFDARFFLMHADALDGNVDDFGRASGELSDLAWHSVDQARQLNLPIVTEIVLAEAVAHAMGGGDADAGAPFYDGRQGPARITHLY